MLLFRRLKSSHIEGRRLLFFILVTLCIIGVAITAAYICFRPQDMIDNPEECVVIRIQRKVNGKLTDVVEFDEDQILNLLSTCEVRKSLRRSGTTHEGNIDLLLVLQDCEGIFTVAFGSRNYQVRERRSWEFHILNAEQVKKQLYQAIVP